MTTTGEGVGQGPVRLLMVNTVRAGFNGQMMFILKYLKAMDRTDMVVGFASKGEPAPEIRAMLEALDIKIHVLPPRSKRPLAYLHRLVKAVRANRYDIVHVHGNSSSMALDLLAARWGGAGIRIAHSHNTSTGFPLAHRLLRPLLLREADVRMACGEAAGRWLYGDRPFEVVPIASDPAPFAFDPVKREALRRAMGADANELFVGMIGQLNPVKNPSFLLKALVRAQKARPDIRLALIGPGPLTEPLREEVARLGLADKVTFTGPVQDVPERMMALDLLAMPSLYEGFPNVLVEAQLAGLPALVSERVTRDCDMTGLLSYLPLDEETWADALVRAETVDRAEACARARAAISARGYDIESAAARLKARYLLLAGHSANESN